MSLKMFHKDNSSPPLTRDTRDSLRFSDQVRTCWSSWREACENLGVHLKTVAPGISYSHISPHLAFCQNYHLIVLISLRLSGSEVGLGCGHLSDVPPSTFGRQKFVWQLQLSFSYLIETIFFFFSFLVCPPFPGCKDGRDNFQAPFLYLGAEITGPNLLFLIISDIILDVN